MSSGGVRWGRRRKEGLDSGGGGRGAREGGGDYGGEGSDGKEKGKRYRVGLPLSEVMERGVRMS